MNCPRCRNVIQNNNGVCGVCGYRINVAPPPYGAPQQPYVQPNYVSPQQPLYGQGYNPYNQQPIYSDDKPDTGMNVLSFFIPLIGIIMYFVEKNTKPNRAKSMLKWSLIGWGVSAAISIIISIIMAVFQIGLFAANEVYDYDYDYGYSYGDYYDYDYYI